MSTETAAAAYVRSVNIGRREPNPAKDDVDGTGYDKRPVESAVLRSPGPKHGGLGSGLVGDHVGDTAHHGGDGQAVYAFAREELEWWGRRLGRELADGGFGENLTTSGLAVDAARIGDRWALGDEVVLEVTGPRIPCSTFAHRMGERGWLRTFSEVARSGAYLSIVTGGTVRPGDEVRVIARAEHDVELPVVFRALMGDLGATDVVLAAEILADGDHQWLMDRRNRRRR